MANMTKEQIQALGSAELRAIVRSTSSTGGNWMELLWARRGAVIEQLQTNLRHWREECGKLHSQLDAVKDKLRLANLCEDCPPIGYPTDKTRCAPCPRRDTATAAERNRLRTALELAEKAIDDCHSYRTHNHHETLAIVRAALAHVQS